MSEPKTYEIVKHVSESFFERTPETNIICRGCQGDVRVIVSILTVKKCPHCGATLKVEFKTN